VGDQVKHLGIVNVLRVHHIFGLSRTILESWPVIAEFKRNKNHLSKSMVSAVRLVYSVGVCTTSRPIKS
jgi:hypothetical protein